MCKWESITFDMDKQQLLDIPLESERESGPNPETLEKLAEKYDTNVKIKRIVFDVVVVKGG